MVHVPQSPNASWLQSILLTSSPYVLVLEQTKQIPSVFLFIVSTKEAIPNKSMNKKLIFHDNIFFII